MLRTPLRILIVLVACLILTGYQSLESVDAQRRAKTAEDYAANLQSLNYDMQLQLQTLRDKLNATREQWGACEDLKEQCCK